MSLKDRIRTIRRALKVFIDEGAIAELRLPQSDDGPQSGLFDDTKKMAAAAAGVSGTVPGVFFTPNPVAESFRGGVENRLAKTSSAIKDTDIERRKWLHLDFDPVRPIKTPSTDVEFNAVMQAARGCRDSLRESGWADPVLASSGNGVHLLYRVDLPNNQKSLNLVRECLAALSLQFSTAQVTLDLNTGNASRLTRVYGTINRKGAETDDREYGISRLLEVPEGIETVSEKQVAEIARRLPIAPTERTASEFDVEGWLRKYKVPVSFDREWNQGGRKWILAECPWSEAHRRTAFIVQFPDGNVAAGCLHKSCSGRNWPDLRKEYESEDGYGEAEPSEMPEKLGRTKPTNQTQELLDFASPDAQFFVTPQGDAYASVRVEDHFENYSLEEKAMKRWLRRQYFRKTKIAPKAQAVQEALSQFDAVARYEGAEEDVFLRVAESNSVNYLDLGDKLWRAVEFSANGWRVVENPPVKFRRARTMRSLPTPISGGDINDLKEFLNLRGNDDWVLYIGSLLENLFFRTAYPVLEFCGEAGSGKTTQSRIRRALVDPNGCPENAMPRDVRDLMILARNSWVLVFDNLSYLPPWFSDSLCRLSTGGGFVTRQLYTDVDEVVFEARRPVILNGVEEVASRTDLLDRSIVLDLPVIEEFRPETEFWDKFEAARPRLLGALLDVAVDAIRRRPKVQLKEVPRLADFTIMASAAEPALGLSRGSFMRAYLANRRNANAIALEASPVATAILTLADIRSWRGTATNLLAKLTRMSRDRAVDRRSWPRNARVLSGMLRRLATALRKEGVEVKFWRDETRRRQKMISISKILTNEKKQ